MWPDNRRNDVANDVDLAQMSPSANGRSWEISTVTLNGRNRPMLLKNTAFEQSEVSATFSGRQIVEPRRCFWIGDPVFANSGCHAGHFWLCREQSPRHSS